MAIKTMIIEGDVCQFDYFCHEIIPIADDEVNEKTQVKVGTVSPF